MQAAEAIDFAHRQGVVHRDIKPSNLLLDGRSDLWITDFGLARIQGGAQLTATGDLPGTPRYMSPEQIQARRVVVDHRTDIYSLGATLYELLTMRPAFEGDDLPDLMRRVVAVEPKPPRRIDRAVPRDLETIVLKAMAKERDDRYQTAKEMADDMRRFLDGSPVLALRPSLLDRASRWARRRRKAVAAAAVLLVAAVLTLSVGVVLVLRAEARAEDRERDSRFESLMQRILRLRLTTHFSGWSADAWDLVREAAKLRPGDAEAFQGEAAATLSGLDARLVEWIEGSVSSLAFDPKGGRLWMGRPGEKSRVWIGPENRIEILDHAPDGPFAFRADGTALQLGKGGDPTTGRPSLRLWSEADKSTVEIRLLDGTTLRSHALSADGTRVGAVVESAEGARKMIVRDSASDRTSREIDYQAEGLAFSPDAALVAAWDDAGEIRLWTLPDAVPLATLKAGSTPVRCVAFGRVPGRPAPTSPASRWLLASGDAGGEVIVWNLEGGVIMNRCRGSQYDVHAIAFSPDGTTLASAGRSHARLWDVAGGRLLLELERMNRMTSIAFSPDGTRLAVGCEAAFGDPGQVDVYELNDGRGVRTLRGLRGQVCKTLYSPDGRFVAGLSQDWRVAIWEADSGRLQLILDVPQGLVADNSGLTFSPDGRRFAFAAGRRAKLWDVASGSELGAWTLPEGMQDTLTFRVADRLMLLRMETLAGRSAPIGATKLAEHPRVLRLYDLTGARPTVPIREIPDFNRGVHHTLASPDGTFFVAEGRSGPNGETRSVNAYDSSTGARLWSRPSRVSPGRGSGLKIDPTGKVFCVAVDDVDHMVLLDASTRAEVGELETTPNSLGPDAKRWLWVTKSRAGDHGVVYGVHERERKSPLVQISVDALNLVVLTPFSPDGRRLAWGNADGSVSVCDLDEVGRRMGDVGLGW